MKTQKRSPVSMLKEKGVAIISNPAGVEIGPEVNLDRISAEGVVIHTGCKILGAGTLILPGVELGREGPVTVDNCQMGPDVSLKGGYFKDSVFLEKVSLGLGAHVREGCILEEEASVAHTVALKQTILFPFVTLGSLINFCDCFMAGGTSRQDHSEVGSSFIHFNYTPNQDKATPSLLGDVPRGVMLDQRPIFMGGQGGLVGPCRLEYGTVTVAGGIVRKDELRPGRMIIAGAPKSGSISFEPGVYRNVRRIISNNLIYIANLIALAQWYRHVRTRFVSERFPEPLVQGLTDKVDMALAERIQRLELLCAKMPASIAAYNQITGGRGSSSLVAQKRQLSERWPEIKEMLIDRQNHEGDVRLKDVFLTGVEKSLRDQGEDYLAVIRNLSQTDKSLGTRWLQGIIDDIVKAALDILRPVRED